MSFIYMIIMGLIVGVIARAIKRGADAMGWILTIVLGIIGALVGGFLAGMLGMNANGDEKLSVKRCKMRASQNKPFLEQLLFGKSL